jgi:hypothetical protein
MVNGRREFLACCAVLLLAGCVLTAAARLRSAEYDEQYTIFLTSGMPRPAWPDGPFQAGLAAVIAAGHASMAETARDLRATDVHPPLYFWAVSCWRAVAGDGLFVARLLSVGCSLGALAAVGWIARTSGLPPALAMLLTLGCYGFAYTGCIARGFALAQMLSLAGLACGIRARGWRQGALTGGLLGAAVLANYLAAFVAVTVILMPGLRRFNIQPPEPACPRPESGRSGPVSIMAAAFLGFLPFLLLAFWFFVAQRASRTGQFPPFEPWPALVRLARYSAANLTGGLPLYFPPSTRSFAMAVLATGIAALVGLIAVRWRYVAIPDGRLLLAACALAPPAGLFTLGFVFNNTPIELRYLSFATPFVALLLAGAIPGVSSKRAIIAIVLTIQAGSITGLMFGPETMQPARATAIAAAALVGNGVVLVPFGNDGVGIVGAFASEAPPALPLLVITGTDTDADIRARAKGFSRVALALLAQDDASRATIATMRSAFTHPDWRADGYGFNVITYQRTSAAE